MRVWIDFLGSPLGRVPADCQPWEPVHAVKSRLLALHGAALPPQQLGLHSGGRPVVDGASVAEAGWAPGCTVQARLRVRGGGGDGGSTGAESRSSYLEMYAAKKAAKVDPAEEQLAKWTTCRLSGEPLGGGPGGRAPVVADELGALFNKEAIVAALLAKALPPPLQHITSLKSLLTLRLEPVVRDGPAAVSVDRAGPANGAAFCCPVTGQPLSGRGRAFALRPSGHVVSEKALKEARPAVEDLVGGPWKEEDLLPLNGSVEQVEALYAKMLARLSVQRARKAAKAAGAKSLSSAPANGSSKAAAAHGRTQQSEGLAGAAAEPGPTNGARSGSSGGSGAEGGSRSHKPGGSAETAAVEGAGGEKARARLPPGGGAALPEKRRAQGEAAGGRRPPGGRAGGGEGAKKARVGGSDASAYRPQVASDKVWSSIFLSSKPQAAETYSCRSLSSRGWGL